MQYALKSCVGEPKADNIVLCRVGVSQGVSELAPTRNADCVPLGDQHTDMFRGSNGDKLNRLCIVTCLVGSCRG